MTTTIGRCPTCSGYYRLKDGLIPAHIDQNDRRMVRACTGEGSMPDTEEGSS
jgi:hypothetical protein